MTVPSPAADNPTPTIAAPQRRRLRWWQTRIAGDPVFIAAILALVLIAVAAITGPIFFPIDPMQMVAMPLVWPGTDAQYPLGTDALGRDLFAGVVYGARVSLTVGLAAAAVGLVIGGVLGAVAGYFGGWLDNVFVRIAEIFQTVPPLLLSIVIIAVGGRPSLPLIALAIGISSWPTVGRLVRSQFMALREADFVLAARSLGYGQTRVIFREILPNALPTIIIAMSMMIANGILAEAGLSFLGLTDANLMSWGSMIGAGRDMLATDWYVTTVPGIAILITVVALNLLGDGINDLLNPRAAE